MSPVHQRIHRLAAQLLPVECEGSGDDAVTFVVDEKTHVATITLNRPKERNSMSPPILNGVIEAARKAQLDPNVRCVLLTGEGNNFCGGAAFGKGDPLKPAEKRNGDEAIAPGGQLVGGENGLAGYSPFLSLLEVKVPIVGALQGHAIGGGWGLALMSDIRVVHAKSQYGANFVRLGIHPGMATTYITTKLIGYEAGAEMFYTGKLATGKELKEKYGLCSYCCETPEEVKKKGMEIAVEIAGNAPIAMRWTKRSLRRAAGLHSGPVRDAAWEEAQLQTRTFESEDFKEGSQALIQKRAPNFKGK